MWLNLYGGEPAISSKKAFFGCFCTYIRQPNNHIGWATSMPFASINSTNPRKNPWNFHKKKIENWWFWKKLFFWVGHFDFFFKKNYLLFSNIQYISFGLLTLITCLYHFSGALGTLGDLNELNDVGSGTTINYEDLNLDNAVQVCLKNYLKQIWNLVQNFGVSRIPNLEKTWFWDGPDSSQTLYV